MEEILLSEEELEYILVAAAGEYADKWFGETKAFEVRKKLEDAGKLRKNFDGSLEISRDLHQAMASVYESSGRVRLVRRLSGEKEEEFVLARREKGWLCLQRSDGKGIIREMSEDDFDDLIQIKVAQDTEIFDNAEYIVLMRDLREAVADYKSGYKDKAEKKLTGFGLPGKLSETILHAAMGEASIYSFDFVNHDLTEDDSAEFTVIVGDRIYRVNESMREYRDAVSYRECTLDEAREAVRKGVALTAEQEPDIKLEDVTEEEVQEMMAILRKLGYEEEA